MLVAVDDARRIGLVEQAAISVEALFVDGLSHLHGNFADAI